MKNVILASILAAISFNVLADGVPGYGNTPWLRQSAYGTSAMQGSVSQSYSAGGGVSSSSSVVTKSTQTQSISRSTTTGSSVSVITSAPGVTTSSSSSATAIGRGISTNNGVVGRSVTSTTINGVNSTTARQFSSATH